MKNKLPALVFCLLLTAGFVAADDKGLEIRPAGKELFETKPRQTVTTTFRVTNTTDREHELISEVELPEDWVLITDDFPFHLRSNENRTKLVSFFVPETTPAGRYKITYIVWARKYPSVRDFYTIEVVVLPNNRVEVKVLEAPAYVTAGQEYQTSFLVANKSNTENTIDINIDSSEDIDFVADTEIFKLAPGQSQIVTVIVRPNAKIKKMVKHHLQLTARIVHKGKTKMQAKAISSTEIIPQTTRANSNVDAIVLATLLDRQGLKCKTTKPMTQTEVACEKSPDKKGQGLRFATAGPEPAESAKGQTLKTLEPVLTASKTDAKSTPEVDLSKKKRVLKTVV